MYNDKVKLFLQHVDQEMKSKKLDTLAKDFIRAARLQLTLNSDWVDINDSELFPIPVLPYRRCKILLISNIRKNKLPGTLLGDYRDAIETYGSKSGVVFKNEIFGISILTEHWAYEDTMTGLRVVCPEGTLYVYPVREIARRFVTNEQKVVSPSEGGEEGI
jgi:hypothetical protein